MNEDRPDIFRQMDAMMARLMREMEANFLDGIPPHAGGYRIIIHRGNLPPNNREFSSVPSPDSKEPVTEVHRIGNEVKVIAGLPGVTNESLRLDVQGDLLVIDAGDADLHYRTSAHLPPVDVASMQKSLKNGVLEVTFSVLPGETAGKGNQNP